jgi:hypothetical protein
MPAPDLPLSRFRNWAKGEIAEAEEGKWCADWRRMNEIAFHWRDGPDQFRLC